MKYFLGSLTTLFVIMIVSYVLKPIKSSQSLPTLRYNQSHIFEILKPVLPPLDKVGKIKKKYQSIDHKEKTKIKVIILDDNAYWIKNNIFYYSSINEDGIDQDAAKVVDTIGMDKVQLDKMLFIMDRLRDGKDNDHRSPGDY